MLILAQFISYRYPEDNMVLGIFSTLELAEQAISDAIADDKLIYLKYTQRSQQNRNYYYTEELEIDKYNFSSITKITREPDD